jgi:hypothetical protein
MTEPLSPAAQAVFSAWAKPVDVDRSLVVSGQALEAQARGALAAALRAAAAHCHSQEIREADHTTRRWICVDELLAIAAELEGQ